MATDLSKFLWSASDGADEAILELVASFKAIEKYAEQLEMMKIGPSGIIGKLTVIGSAQAFLLNR